MTSSSPPAWGFGSTARGGVANRKDRDLAAVSPTSYDRNLALKTKQPVFSMGAKLKGQ